MKNANNGVIVIGDHVQALGIIRSLGRRNIPVYLLHDKSFCIGRFSKYTKKFIKCPDINNSSMLVDFLVEFAKKEKANDWILIPTNDAAVYTLSKNKKILEEYYKVPTPSWDIVKFAYNKKLTYQLAEKNNIRIPKTIYPDSLDTLKAMLSDIEFPVIINPAIMHHFYEKTKTKVFKANTEDELIRAYIRASSILDPSEIMVQEVIPGGPTHLYSFCSFFKQKKVLGMCIGRRSRQRPMDFGKASTFVESVHMPELIEFGTILLNTVNYDGLSEVEFKEDPRDGKFKLLEINARTWLWHTLAIRCGVDFPYLLYKDMIGENVVPIDSFKENIKWVHIYTDLSTAIREIIKGNLRVSSYLESLKGDKEFGVLSPDDPLPFIAETIMLPYLWLVR